MLLIRGGKIKPIVGEEMENALPILMTLSSRRNMQSS